VELTRRIHYGTNYIYRTSRCGSNTSTVTIASGTRSGETLSAVGNEGVMIYVSNGYTGDSVYAFSDGSDWKQVITGTNITAS